MKREDPNFVPPTSVHAKDTVARLGGAVIGNGEKRARDERMDEDERESKRERTEEEDDGEEMEIEEDEESGTKTKNGGTQHKLSVSSRILTSGGIVCPRRHSSSGPSTIRSLAVYKSPTRSNRRCTIRLVPTVRSVSFLLHLKWHMNAPI